jgi:hypothetical protein
MPTKNSAAKTTADILKVRILRLIILPPLNLLFSCDNSSPQKEETKTVMSDLETGIVENEKDRLSWMSDRAIEGIPTFF